MPIPWWIELWLEMERKAWLSFYTHPIIIIMYWTHTTLNRDNSPLQRCWGSYFLSPFIMWMSPSKASQGKAAVRLLGSWQCSCRRGRIQSTELLHITVPLLNMGLCTVISSEAATAAVCILHSLPFNPTLKLNESTRNWCKVTGSPHSAIWTGVWTPEAS